MGYLMRFFVISTASVSLYQLEEAMQRVDARYRLANTDIPDIADLLFDDTLLAVLEINRPGDDMFEDDLAEFDEIVGPDSDPATVRVREVLQQTKALVVAEVFWEGTEADAALEKLDPLWNWLFQNVRGLAQADTEGFYDSSGLVLERRFTL
jgi:hypothetical protein